jgi:His/Glu/Gln/Arg/opine family amino acid ABC transporter permease subunit
MNSLTFSRYVFAQPYLGWLCQGIIMTLVIGMLGAALGILIALVVLHCRIVESRILRIVGAIYVVLFRNLPVLPLLLFLTFAMPGIWREALGLSMPRGFEFYFLIMGLALNAGAYLAEILRAGMEAVPCEQIDTAHTLGLSLRIIRRRIIFPQAIRIVAPALTSRYIHIIKNSSMALIIPLAPGKMEMVGQAGRIAGQTFAWAEPLIFAAIGYLALALILSRLLNRWATHAQARIGNQL